MAIEIVDFPIKNGDFPLLCKRSPEGKSSTSSSNLHERRKTKLFLQPKALPGHRAQKIAEISGPLHAGLHPAATVPPSRSRDAAAQAAWTKNLRTESLDSRNLEV